MNLDYTAYELSLRTQEQRNEVYLAQFTSSLRASGVSTERIKHEVRDVSRFLNGYLLHEDDPSVEMGCYLVDDYMENYVIRHSSWASPEAIERSGDSLASFYHWMLDEQQVDEDAYEELQATIEAQLPLWQEACNKANSAESAGTSDGLLGAIQDTVTRSVTTPDASSTTVPDTIDMFVLSLLRLIENASSPDVGDQEASPTDPLGESLERLRERGLIDDGASASAAAPMNSGPYAVTTFPPALTPRGTAEADQMLAALGFAP